ncbi:MAG: DUF1559 domain-containing protein [Planctomycetaceae bacterium]|nr:DUF1559 domain-containing protein [Planctomycetaceae bacterium]
MFSYNTNSGFFNTKKPVKDLLLGSSHPETVNFLVGDGSVRGISITALPATICALTQVNDGDAVTIP